jgi:uncharacterized coiled-coil protein SlyX
MSKWEPTRNELKQVYDYVMYLEDKIDEQEKIIGSLRVSLFDANKLKNSYKNDLDELKSLYEKVKATKNDAKEIIQANESESHYRALAKKISQRKERAEGKDKGTK